MKINRRTFLKFIQGLGLSTVLPLEMPLIKSDVSVDINNSTVFKIYKHSSFDRQCELVKNDSNDLLTINHMSISVDRPMTLWIIKKQYPQLKYYNRQFTYFKAVLLSQFGGLSLNTDISVQRGEYIGFVTDNPGNIDILMTGWRA